MCESLISKLYNFFLLTMHFNKFRKNPWGLIWVGIWERIQFGWTFNEIADPVDDYFEIFFYISFWLFFFKFYNCTYYIAKLLAILESTRNRNWDHPLKRIHGRMFTFLILYSCKIYKCMFPTFGICNHCFSIIFILVFISFIDIF